MNVLITCVGRRGYMIDYFRIALDGKGKVLAANSDALSIGMLRADKNYVVPLVHESSYISSLLKICVHERISLLLSLFDMDLPHLAKAREQFKAIGTEVIVSDPWVIETCADKWLTYLFLKARGFNTPTSYITLSETKNALANGLLVFPLILKPRQGMGSMFVYVVHTLTELQALHAYCAKQIEHSQLQHCIGFNNQASVIIQQQIDGEAYGLDVFNDLQGQHLSTVSKLKLSTWGGETDRAKVIASDTLQKVGLELSTSLKHRGNLDVDVIVDSSKGETHVIELNPRFGGCYPLSHLAGVDFPNALIQMVRGDTPMTGIAKTGLIAMKEIVPRTSNQI